MGEGRVPVAAGGAKPAVEAGGTASASVMKDEAAEPGRSRPKIARARRVDEAAEGATSERAGSMSASTSGGGKLVGSAPGDPGNSGRLIPRGGANDTEEPKLLEPAAVECGTRGRAHDRALRG